MTHLSSREHGPARHQWSWPSIVLAALAIILIVLGTTWFPRAASQSQIKTGRTVELTGQHSDQQFVAGDNILITANISDDLFAAGREVTLDGARAHSLVTGARKLILKNSEIHDLLAGGMDVEILGKIEDDAIVGVCPICPIGTGNLLVGKDARIGHDARFASGSLEIQGDIAGNLRAAARRMVISGDIGGKADLKAKEIVIADGARLGGELIARSPTKPQISPGATVAGPIREIETKVDIPEPGDFVKALLAISIAAAIAFSIGILVLGALSQLVLPEVLQTSVSYLRHEPWARIGYGLALALLIPATAALLIATIIGAPAGLVVLAAYIVVAALALITSGYAIGLWLRDRRSAAIATPSTGGRIGWTILGLIVLFLAGVVPFAGWAFVVLAFLGGLGSIARSVWERLKEPSHA
jgi:drug/metabolite transporter superfamily protein YnfA